MSLQCYTSFRSRQHCIQDVFGRNVWYNFSKLMPEWPKLSRLRIILSLVRNQYHTLQLQENRYALYFLEWPRGMHPPNRLIKYLSICRSVHIIMNTVLPTCILPTICILATCMLKSAWHEKSCYVVWSFIVQEIPSYETLLFRSQHV